MSDQSGISIELLKQFIKDIGGKPIIYKRTDEEVEAMLLENDSFYDRILEGYLYNINDRLHTGSGGARVFYKEMLKQGLSHNSAGESIVVFSDLGKYNITQLTVNKESNDL